MNGILLGVGVLVLAASGLRADLRLCEFESGGETFDFDGISSRRFARIFDEAGNIAEHDRAGWTAKTKSIAFLLPTTNGGVWRVSCRYKLRHTQAGQALFAVGPGGYSMYVIPESAQRWSVLSGRAHVPPGEDKVTLRVVLQHGDPVFEYRDLTVIEETPRDPVVASWKQLDDLDGTFAVSQGQPGMLEFVWRRVDGRPRCAPGDFRGRLDLPPGIAFVGSNCIDQKTACVVTNANGSTVVTFAMSRGADMAGSLKGYVSERGHAFVVKATGLAGGRGTGRLTLDYVGTAVPKFSIALTPVEFMVVPRIKAKAPARYANGIMPGGTVESLCGTAASEMASFMGDCGVSWVVGRASPDVYARWRTAGINRITPGIWPCVDGYHICSRKDPVPESDRYVALTADLEPTTVVAGSVCPVTVYERSEYFRTKTVPYIQECIRGTDGCWANWEPGAFKGKGCFCDRCCRKFAEHLGKPYEHVKSAWPKCAMKGGAWFAEAERFRSLEHAKVVKTIDAVVRDATGGVRSLGFIPAIAWIEMSNWWRPRAHAAEAQAIDYAGSLKWICPWGPYVAWESEFPYVRQNRKPICHFLAARDVRRTVDADYPAHGRPKLMALPHGRQCGHWITQPEHIGMALDSYFFNGHECSVLYFYPQGYDARYWERFADATSRSARYEGYVVDGRRCDDTVGMSPIAPYAMSIKAPSAYLPDEHGVSMLQAVAWERGGRRIVAVFNFWQGGEAFFNLKLSGMSGSVAIVDEKDVLRAIDAQTLRWDAKALAEKGVNLAVPASRCRVFEFRSDGSVDDATSIFTDAELQRVLDSRRERLEKAAQKDAEQEDANGPPFHEFMPVI